MNSDAIGNLQGVAMPARVLDFESILKAEHDENQLRKDFTASERVAIGEALERELGERRGRPKENPPQGAEFQKGQETRDIAAAKAGFGSKTSYERAKRIVERGAPELIEAVDKGEISLFTAGDVIIANHPKHEDQCAALENHKSGSGKRPANKGAVAVSFSKKAIVLEKLKSLWRKASEDERAAFRDFIDEPVMDRRRGSGFIRRRDSLILTYYRPQIRNCSIGIFLLSP